MEEAKELQENIRFCFIDYTTDFDCVDQTNWNILKETEIAEHHICLLRNLYGCQEAIARTRHGTMRCFQIEKGVHQGYILSPGYLT